MANDFHAKSRPYEISLPVADRRRYSSILVGFPWEWEGIIAVPQGLEEYAEKVPGYRNFIRSLHQFETCMFSLRSSQAASDILKGLGVQIEYTSFGQCPMVVSAHKKELTPIEFQNIASVLAAYAFLEVLLIRAKLVPRSPSQLIVDMRLPLSQTKRQEIYGMDDISDLFQILFDFRRIMAKLPAGGDQMDALESDYSLVTLLRMLARSDSKNDYYRIESNMLHAAFHMNIMESVIFSEDQVPDLPRDMKTCKYLFHVEGDPAQHDPLQGDTRRSASSEAPPILTEALATSSLSNVSPGMLRNAFQVAGLLSPIFLLRPKQLTKISLHRRTLLELAAKIRPCKLEILWKVEMSIWDALLDLASGNVRPCKALTDLGTQLPWSDLEAAAEIVRVYASAAQRSDPSGGLVSAAAGVSTLSSAPNVQDVDDGEALTGFSPLPSQTQAQSSSDGNESNSAISDLRFTDLPVQFHEDVHMSHPMDGPDFEREQADGYAMVTTDSGAQLGLVEGSALPGSDGGHRLDAEMQAEGAPMFVNPSLLIPEESPADLLKGLSSDAGDLVNATTGKENTGATISAEVEGDEAQQSDSDLSSLDSNSSSENEDEAAGSSGSSKEASLSPLPGGTTPTNPPIRKPRKTSKLPYEEKSWKGRNPSAGNKSSKGSKLPDEKLAKPSPARSSLKSGKGAKSSLGKGSKRSRIDEGDTFEDPIDVDQFYSIFEPSVVKAFVWPKVIDFTSSEASQRLESTKSFTAWDADGKEETFTPQAHYRIFLEAFETFMDRAEKSYIENRPRFLSEPEKSCLAVTDYKTFSELDDVGKRTFLKGKTAGIVRGWPVDPGLKFDAKGLRTLTACLTAPVDLQNYAHPLAETNICPVTVTGTAQDLVDNAHEGGIILNGLDFPKWNSNLEPNAFAVDLVAWEHTRGIHFSDDRGALYPGPDMNWSLGAHQWAVTNNHVDADGTFTRNLIGCGLKGWGFLVERPSGPKLSSPDFFLDKGFELSAVVEEDRDNDVEGSKYDVEFVILRPGDMLYMKPNTPHFVITLEHSICYGGHSFMTDTMQQTLAGVIHTFVLHSYLTNAVHHPSRLLLRRILLFYYGGLLEDRVPQDDPSAFHLPDCRSIDGLLNLLSVCVLVVMGNVLDFRTYCSPNQYEDTQADRRLMHLMIQIDLNSIPENERKAICYARGVALHVMAWVRAHCIIKRSDGTIVEDLPSRFCIQIANAMLIYKKRAEISSKGGGPHCTVNRVNRQISNMVACDAHLERMWQRRDELPSDSLEVLEKSQYSVEWEVDWKRKWNVDQQDFLELGTTEFDRKYFASYKEWCEYQVKLLSTLGPPEKKVKRDL